MIMWDMNVSTLQEKMHNPRLQVMIFIMILWGGGSIRITSQYGCVKYHLDKL